MIPPKDGLDMPGCWKPSHGRSFSIREDKETLLTDSVFSQGFGEGVFYQTRIRVVAVVLILPVLQFGKPVTNAHQIVKCLNQHCGKHLKSTDKAAFGSGDTKSKTS